MQATPGVPEGASYYDTSALKDTLERLCDFDRINDKRQRISVGAVNVGTGNFVYFDNHRTVLRAEHFMASGALPPPLPRWKLTASTTGMGVWSPIPHCLMCWISRPAVTPWSFKWIYGVLEDRSQPIWVRSATA